MKHKLFQLYQKYRKLILYGLIGGFCAGLDFAVYTFLVKFNIHYQVANVVGIHCGIFCSFALNRHYNYKVKDKFLLRFLSFYGIGLIGLALSTAILWLMVEKNNMNEIFAKIVAIILVALIQFLLNTFITFRKSKNYE